MSWISRLKNSLRICSLDKKLDDELEFHIEMRTREFIASGMEPQRARNQAISALGNCTLLKEKMLEVSTIEWIETLWLDVRYAVRTMRRSPGFTTVAVLSLALGIGANTAIFSVIDALMLRMLPVKNPEQLVLFGPANYGIDYPLLERLRGIRVFEGISAIILTDRSGVTINAPSGGLDAGQVAVGLVTGNYFPLLGIQAVIGRTLTQEDDRVPGGHPLAVISYGYWERRFARADIVGRNLTVSGLPYTIVGIAPRGFTGDRAGRPIDLWIPTMMEPQVMPGCRALRCGAEVRIIGRLMPGVTIQLAQAAAQVVAQQFERDQAGTHPPLQQLQQIAQVRLELQPAARGYAPQLDSFSQSLTILMIVVGLVLLIACANIANLLLARSAARQREMAVRLAIGAGRMRILRQMLTESVLLAVMGGAVGVLLSVWGIGALTAVLASGPAMVMLEARIALEVHLAGRVLAFTGALCLLTSILFGLAPAFRLSKTSLSSGLTGLGASLGTAKRGFSLNKLLVISQVSMSLVLIIGTGLFVRTLRSLKRQDLGFDREHLLLVWSVPVQTGRLDLALANLWSTAQTRLSSLPEVISASASDIGLLSGIDRGGPSESMRIQGQTPKPGMLSGWAVVAPKFFETAGIPLRSGRDFTERDNEAAPRVAIVNETTAHFYFGDESPIGKRFAKPGETGYRWEIIGVVKDMKHGTPRGRRAQFYFPYRQDLSHLQNLCLVVHTAGDPAPMAARVRQELRDIDPNLPIIKIDTIEEQLNAVLAQERLTATLTGVFGAMAVLLACLGLYGLMAYTVARRTNEIGIRLAVGATRVDVLGMILQESLVLVTIGIALGLPATIAATRLISTRLFGVTPTDPLTIATAAALMLAVAAAAVFFPARRASRADPMRALRYE